VISIFNQVIPTFTNPGTNKARLQLVKMHGIATIVLIGLIAVMASAEESDVCGVHPMKKMVERMTEKSLLSPNKRHSQC
jgi:hypothetical protein